MRISPEEIRSRWQRVREEMAASGIDVLVTGALAQMESRGTLRYLTDYILPVFTH